MNHYSRKESGVSFLCIPKMASLVGISCMDHIQSKHSTNSSKSTLFRIRIHFPDPKASYAWITQRSIITRLIFILTLILLLTIGAEANLQRSWHYSCIFASVFTRFKSDRRGFRLTQTMVSETSSAYSIIWILWGVHLAWIRAGCKGCKGPFSEMPLGQNNAKGW